MPIENTFSLEYEFERSRDSTLALLRREAERRLLDGSGTRAAITYELQGTVNPDFKSMSGTPMLYGVAKDCSSGFISVVNTRGTWSASRP
jgi:hypothetical protein